LGTGRERVGEKQERKGEKSLRFEAWRYFGKGEQLEKEKGRTSKHDFYR